MEAHAAQDWRPTFEAANLLFPSWFSFYQADLTSALHKLRIPTLLLWSDADPVSPVSVGQSLAWLLPDAQLHIFPGGDHDLANAMAVDIAPLMDRHLMAK